VGRSHAIWITHAMTFGGQMMDFRAAFKSSQQLLHPWAI